MNINNNHNQGFTLIEALIAIFIFSVALVSLITITAKGITGTTQARDQITAQFLAQEGIELMRNYRDTLIINENTADLESVMPCNGENNESCYIKRHSGNLLRYTLEPLGPAGLIPDSFGLHYEPVNNGKFSRKIWFEVPNQADLDEIEVHSRVDWLNGSIPRSVHLVTILKHWGRATN